MSGVDREHEILVFVSLPNMGVQKLGKSVANMFLILVFVSLSNMGVP